MKRSRTSLVALLASLASALAAGCVSGPVPQQTAPDGTIWVSRAVPTGKSSTSAILIERGTPGQVPVAQAYDYEIRVTNLTNQPLDDVVLMEHRNTDVGIDKAEPEPAEVAEGMARWTIGTLPPGESRTIKVTATPRAPGELQSRCEVTYRAQLYGVTTVFEPRLQLDRELPAQSLVGEPVEVKLQVKNPGSGPARGVVIAGELPLGLETIDGKTAYRFEVGELEAGAAKEYVVKVRGTIQGDYIVKAAAVGSGDLSAEAPPTEIAVRRPSLSVDVEGPKEWVLDRDARFVIRVNNSGDGPTRDATLTFELPEGVAFERGANEPSSTPREVRWNLGSLAAGAESEIEVFVRPSKAGELSGAIKLAATYCDPAETRWKTNVVGVPALLLEVSDTRDPIAVGGEQTYNIAVTNQGSAAGRDIQIVCQLEDTMEFVSVGGAGKGTQDANKIVLDKLDSLEPGATAEWTVVVKAIAPGDVRFRVELTSAEMERPVEETESTRFYK